MNGRVEEESVVGDGRRLFPCWPYFDPEYDNLSERINPPSVNIDNDSCSDCTLVKVDSLNKPRILLKMIQVLCDLDLMITKAYISSDGGWFMDVFHVTDQQGKKLEDKKAIEFIETALRPKRKIKVTEASNCQRKAVGMHSIGEQTAIELIGTDRPGLLSEIFAVLNDEQCNILAAELWTHKTRVACVVYVSDKDSCNTLSDPEKVSVMCDKLKYVLGVGGIGGESNKAHTTLSVGSTHVDRRLHQLMLADMDYDNSGEEIEGNYAFSKPVVTIDYCREKGYSMVNIRCKDRPKLLFDIICTFTDMHCDVFHASAFVDGLGATQVLDILTAFFIKTKQGQMLVIQEYYIRRNDGGALDSEDEKERLSKCIQAAILRRVSEGLSLELCATDKVGLLSVVTRIIREHGLSVLRAGVNTEGGHATNVFYVRDSSGNPVDMKAVEALERDIGQSLMFNVKKVWNKTTKPHQSNVWAKSSFSFGTLLGRLLA